MLSIVQLHNLHHKSLLHSNHKTPVDKLKSNGFLFKGVKKCCTKKISTASARVRPLAGSPCLPWSSCHSKWGLLDAACSSAAVARSCLLSNTLLIMLSASGSGPLATSRLNMLWMCLQSSPQNHSPSGSSCGAEANMHNSLMQFSHKRMTSNFQLQWWWCPFNKQPASETYNLHELLRFYMSWVSVNFSESNGKTQLWCQLVLKRHS